MDAFLFYHLIGGFQDNYCGERKNNGQIRIDIGLIDTSPPGPPTRALACK